MKKKPNSLCHFYEQVLPEGAADAAVLHLHHLLLLLEQVFLLDEGGVDVQLSHVVHQDGHLRTRSHSQPTDGAIFVVVSLHPLMFAAKA